MRKALSICFCLLLVPACRGPGSDAAGAVFLHASRPAPIGGEYVTLYNNGRIEFGTYALRSKVAHAGNYSISGDTIRILYPHPESAAADAYLVVKGNELQRAAGRPLRIGSMLPDRVAIGKLDSCSKASYGNRTDSIYKYTHYKFVGPLLEKYRRRFGSYPVDLDSLSLLDSVSYVHLKRAWGMEYRRTEGGGSFVLDGYDRTGFLALLADPEAMREYDRGKAAQFGDCLQKAFPSHPG